MKLNFEKKLQASKTFIIDCYHQMLLEIQGKSIPNKLIQLMISKIFTQNFLSYIPTLYD